MNLPPHIPYFQTTRYRIQTMLELAQVKPGDIGADLGSGDGRIVLAFAKVQIEMHGYEIDETRRQRSQAEIEKQKLTHKAFIHPNNFWGEPLSRYTFITVYGMPDIMVLLAKKLQKELQPGTKILSNYYTFPIWDYVTKKDNIYLYRI